MRTTTMRINDNGDELFAAKKGAQKVAFWGLKSGFLGGEKWLFDPQ